MFIRKRGKGTCALSVALEPSNPMIAFADGEGDGGGDGGGGGGGGGEKMLPQSQVTALIAREVKQAAEKAARDAESRLQAELKKRDEELERTRAELETAGKSAEERARIQAEQQRKAELTAAQQREQKIAEDLKAQTDRAEASARRLVDFQVKQHLSSGLMASNALPTAHEDALRSFTTDCKVTLDDDGKITSLLYKDVSYPTPAKAAEAFLKERPHFAKPANNGGAGARGSNGGGSGNSDGRPLHELTREELLQRSANERAARRN